MMRRRVAILTLFASLLGPYTYVRAAEDDSDLMLQERLGGLKIDLPAEQLKPLLGTPARSGKQWLSPATGEYEQRSEYPTRGVALTLGSSKSQGVQKVIRIEAFPPCKLATTRGIRLGSTVAEVRRTYSSELLKDHGESAPPRLVAGSMYGGILFNITAGKVSRIFIGAFAE